MNVYVEIASEALMLVIQLSLVPLIVSLTVGLLVSIFQALTQIQEQTLTFVPKIIATIVSILIIAPWMLTKLMTFCNKVFDLMLQVSRN